MKVALGKKEFLEIYGDSFPTNDGTAIRDFIHVEDIAEAHYLALKKIDQLTKNSDGSIFNLGSEHGFSVKETINCASQITAKEIKTKTSNPRPGEISISLASSARAQKLFGWQSPHSNLNSIILSDWNWRRLHPLGYNK